MLKFKTNVKINGIKPEACIIITVVHSIYSVHDIACEVTSVTEGKHSRTSLHYIGHAVDFGIKNLGTVFAKEILEDIKTALTDEFDVLLEKDHIHVEFQPKG